MNAHRLITAVRRDERGSIVELSGPGWHAWADDVVLDIQFAWNSYSVDVRGDRVAVDIGFGITGKYLTASGAPLESVLPEGPGAG
jgi:hypothetical protein